MNREAGGVPFLVTERLELWLPAIADEPQMFAIINEPQTGRHLGPTSNRADHFIRFQRGAGSWFLHGYGSFMVRLKGRPEMIGNCGVFHSYRGLGEDFDDMPEAGWILAAEHAGRGIAGEAMRAALAWFEREHGPRWLTATRCCCSSGGERTSRGFPSARHCSSRRRLARPARQAPV